MFDSYTYTDISSGFFDNAADKFSDYAHRMVFKILDAEKEVAPQGYVENLYDIVIAAHIVHATHSLENTLRNARSLLKPGGYLVMAEITGTQIFRPGFIMGGLPGWWLGEADGRRLNPAVSALDWDAVLNRTEFSGIETIMHDLGDESKHCTSLFVSRAVDDAFFRLREPLSFTAELPVPESLLIIGGRKIVSSKLISEIQKLLPRAWKRHVQTFTHIDSIDIAKLPPRLEMICLQEADEPLFATSMNPQRLAILENIMMSTRNLLWVTSAGESYTPRASMFHGIARIAPSELPHLQVQVLGLESLSTPKIAARQCMEQFIRLRAAEDSHHSNILWAHDPEVEILANGQMMIPRVVPNESMNELYNASKRTITKIVDATDLPVEAVPGSSVMKLQVASMEEGTTRIQVRFSLHIPAKNGNGIYLICGYCQDGSASPVIALSTSNASVLEIQPTQLIIIDDSDCRSDILTAIATHMLVQAVKALANQARSALLYEAEESQAAMITAELAMQDCQVQFASSSRDPPEGWIKIHARSSKRAIQRDIPRDVQLFVECSVSSATGSLSSSAASTLQASLPPSCVARKLDADLVQEVLQQMNTTALLKESYSYAKRIQAQGEPCDSGYEVVKAAELPGADVSSLIHKKYMTDWQERESLLLTVQPFDLSSTLKSDKTYFMAGMAGGLGLSICEWMLRSGVKYMVITSRNPKVNAEVLEQASRVGAKVLVLPMDVTKRESVEGVVQRVQKTMPPIVGVCNAAMVLTDNFFIDMDVKQLNNTLAPKVYGTEHLDSVFGETPLDFFICLSSVATVIGNIG